MTIREGPLTRVKNGLLKSMVDHPVIYSIQKKYGHNHLELVDKRAIDSIHYVQKKSIPWPYSENLMALYIADDVVTCSKPISKRILKLSQRFHPNLNIKIMKIVNCMNRYNLFDAKENLQCRYEIVSELGMDGNWVIKDDLKDLLDIL